MKMPDDLDATILFPSAIAVMEFEPVRGERIAQIEIKRLELRVPTPRAESSERCSAFDLGVVVAGEEKVSDDYGTAMVGNNTIDLYKTTRLEMKRWGVRQVDIDILHWGSDEQSIKVLTPRAKHGTPRRMLVALAGKKKSSQLADREL